MDEQVLHALAPRPIVVQVEGLDVDALVRSHAAHFAAPAMPAVGTSSCPADPPRTVTSVCLLSYPRSGRCCAVEAWAWAHNLLLCGGVVLVAEYYI